MQGTWKKTVFVPVYIRGISHCGCWVLSWPLRKADRCLLHCNLTDSSLNKRTAANSLRALLSVKPPTGGTARKEQVLHRFHVAKERTYFPWNLKNHSWKMRFEFFFWGHLTTFLYFPRNPPTGPTQRTEGKTPSSKAIRNDPTVTRLGLGAKQLQKAWHKWIANR